MAVLIQIPSYLSSVQNIVKRKSFKFNNIEISNVLSYTYEESKVITEQPLEFGANINDHSFLQPSTVSVDISESKFKNVLESIRQATERFTAISKDIIAGDFLRSDNSFFEDNFATEKLREITRTLQDLNILFDVELPNTRFQNMVLVSIVVGGNPNVQGGFNATLNFKQIRFISETGISTVGSIAQGGLKQKTRFLGVI